VRNLDDVLASDAQARLAAEQELDAVGIAR
jgi:hypothetical protein